jgi:LPXTG-motif cell wall-anchored protein
VPSGDGSGTGVLAALAQGARGNLPLTGVPVWIVFLAGLALLGLGRVLYRRRSNGAVDVLAH